MDNFETKLIEILEERNWEKPTQSEFPSYLDGYRKDKEKIYFEDIHFIWRKYKPISVA